MGKFPPLFHRKKEKKGIVFYVKNSCFHGLLDNPGYPSRGPPLSRGPPPPKNERGEISINSNIEP